MAGDIIIHIVIIRRTGIIPGGIMIGVIMDTIIITLIINMVIIRPIGIIGVLIIIHQRIIKEGRLPSAQALFAIHREVQSYGAPAPLNPILNLLQVQVE
jgi:hypothetical protein